MDSTTPGKAQHADPYVVFQVLVGGQVFSAARTKHLLNAANPAWDETLELPLPEPADPAAPPPLVLRLRLMDKDFSTADDPIAHAEVELRGVRGPVDVMAERRPGQGPLMAVPVGFRFALERDGLPEEEPEEPPAAATLEGGSPPSPAAAAAPAAAPAAAAAALESGSREAEEQLPPPRAASPLLQPRAASPVPQPGSPPPVAPAAEDGGGGLGGGEGGGGEGGGEGGGGEGGGEGGGDGGGGLDGAEAAGAQNWYLEPRPKEAPRRRSSVQFAAPEDLGGSVPAQKLEAHPPDEAPPLEVLVHPMARVLDEAHAVAVAHSPEAAYRPQLPPEGTDSLPAATELGSHPAPAENSQRDGKSPRPLPHDASPTRPLKPIVPASLLRLVPDEGTQLKAQPSWKRVGASARPRGSRRADVPIEAVGARRGSPPSRRRVGSGGDGATLDSPSGSRRRGSCASVASVATAATAASRLSGSPRRRRRKDDEKLALKASDNAGRDMMPSFAGFLCGARVGTPAMRPPEAVVQHLLRKTGG